MACSLPMDAILPGYGRSRAASIDRASKHSVHSVYSVHANPGIASKRVERIEATVTPTPNLPSIPETRVAITRGIVEGPREAGSNTRISRGIPFAEPPIGGLRFAPPRPVQVWSGVRKAD